MIVEKLEQTLNGGYNGLFGEVVTCDCYKLRQLKFIPDVIIDCGANVGVFTRFARQLFPNTIIIAVEPDIDNYENLIRFTPGYESDDDILFFNKAIGVGDIYKVQGRINGAHESYLNNQPLKELVQKMDVECVMLDVLINRYVRSRQTSVLKLDIEGNEEVIWQHKPSMEALKKIDYFTGEIHYTMIVDKMAAEQSKQRSLEALHSLDETHDVVIEGISFWCTKK